MHMDELVALAILAAMAIGEYQTAGVVAFFLLISNLIETRTALGALRRDRGPGAADAHQATSHSAGRVRGAG